MCQRPSKLNLAAVLPVKCADRVCLPYTCSWRVAVQGMQVLDGLSRTKKKRALSDSEAQDYKASILNLCYLFGLGHDQLRASTTADAAFSWEERFHLHVVQRSLARNPENKTTFNQYFPK